MRIKFSMLGCLLLTLLILFCPVNVSCTDYNNFDDNGWSGSVSPGGSYGTATNISTFDYFGFKLSIAKRANVLQDGSVNPNNYAYLGYGDNPGLVVLYHGSSENRDEVSFVPCESVYKNGRMVVRHNIKISASKMEEVLNTQGIGVRLEDVIKSMLSPVTDDIGGMSSNASYGKGHAALSMKPLFEDYLDTYLQKGDGNYNPMLYTRESREAFYDRFVSAMNAGGRAVPLSKDEFLGEEGIVVVEPVVGFENSDYFTFSTFNAICTEQGITAFYSTYKSILAQYSGDYWKDWDDPASGSLTDAERVQERDRLLNGILPFTNKCAGLRSSYEISKIVPLSDIKGQPLSNGHPCADKQGIPADDEIGTFLDYKNAHRAQLYNFGFQVYGTEWGYAIPAEVDSKSSANITVRASQNADGTYHTVAKTSLIAQTDGTMPVDCSLQTAPASVEGLVGGGTSGDTALRVSNLDDGYLNGYELRSYGAYRLGTYGTVSNTSLENFRQSLEGNYGTAESTVGSGGINAGNTYKPVYKFSSPYDIATDFGVHYYNGGGVIEDLWTENGNKGGASIRNVAYNLTAIANNKSKTGATKFTQNDGWTAGSGEVKLEKADDSFGVAVQMLSEPRKVRSYISFARITYDNLFNMSFNIGNNWSQEHTFAKETVFNVNSDKRYMIVTVPNASAGGKGLNNNNNGSNLWNKIADTASKKINQGTNSEVYELEDFRSDVSSFWGKVIV